MARALDAKEESMAALLTRSGLQRPAAKLVAALLRGGALTSAQLAATAGVTPQEVSESTRLLVDAGVIAREAVTTKGPGRPPLIFRLRDGRALERYLDARLAQLEEERGAIEALRARLRDA